MAICFKNSTKLVYPVWAALEIRAYSYGETLKNLVLIVHNQAAGYTHPHLIVYRKRRFR